MSNMSSNATSCISVWVEEEYGFRDWVWHSPFKTVTDFIDWWKNFDKSLINEIVFFSTGVADSLLISEITRKRYENKFGGKWELVNTNEEGFDRVGKLPGYMHLHTEEDSCITP